MQLSIYLPDELSAALAPAGQDLPRAAFEAIALEACREHELSTAQLRRMLGYQTRMEWMAFSKNTASNWSTPSKIWSATVTLTAGLDLQEMCRR